MSVRETLDRINQVTQVVRRDTATETGETGLAERTGLTISLLGILLTVCSAMSSGEHARLTRALLDQTKARAEFHAQDVKHRVAMVALEQVHATRTGAGPATRVEAERLAGTVERYLDESTLARAWSEGYDQLI